MSTYDCSLRSAVKLGLLLGSVLVMAQPAGCNGSEPPDPGDTGGTVGVSGGAPPGGGGAGASGGAGGVRPTGGAGGAAGGAGGICGTGCTLQSTGTFCAAPTVLLLCRPLAAELVGILTANGCAMAEMEGAPGFCCPPEILDQCA
jgi:hypothetical protein